MGAESRDTYPSKCVAPLLMAACALALQVLGRPDLRPQSIGVYSYFEGRAPGTWSQLYAHVTLQRLSGGTLARKLDTLLATKVFCESRVVV